MQTFNFSFACKKKNTEFCLQKQRQWQSVKLKNVWPVRKVSHVTVLKIYSSFYIFGIFSLLFVHLLCHTVVITSPHTCRISMSSLFGCK